jgi:hypothetical protein
MPDFGVIDPTSKNALSGVGLLDLECLNNTAPELLPSDSSSRLLSQATQALRDLASAPSATEPSVKESTVTESTVTEPSSAKRTPAQGAASSSTKRSFSESGATSSVVCNSSKRLRVASTSSEEAIPLLLEIQKMISNVLAKLDQEQPQSPIPDPSDQPIYETIQVAMDEGNDISSDDSSEIGNIDDTDSETESAISQRQARQHRSTQRRRWTEKEEKLLQRLKSIQKRNKGMPADFEIASRLGRTESGVKQHWDIMSQKKHR